MANASGCGACCDEGCQGGCDVAKALDAAEAATNAVETVGQRLRRIEDNSVAVDRVDVLWMLELIGKLGFERVRGLREAAGLLRAAVARGTLLPGKGMGVNNKLLARVAGLVDRYAQDVEDGKL